MTDSLNKLGEVFARCWEDAAFKARFLKDPKAVLGEVGMKIEKMDVEVVENTAGKMYITLPAKPRQAGELSDAELEGASGGAGVSAAGVKLGPVGGGPVASKVDPNKTKLFTTQSAPNATHASGLYCYAPPC